MAGRSVQWAIGRGGVSETDGTEALTSRGGQGGRGSLVFVVIINADIIERLQRLISCLIFKHYSFLTSTFNYHMMVNRMTNDDMMMTCTAFPSQDNLTIAPVNLLDQLRRGTQHIVKKTKEEDKRICMWCIIS